MLSFKTKLGYGLGGLGDCASYTMMGTFAVFYLTSVVGINPAAAGAIAAIGSVWQAICGALVGNISDHSQSKYGKREPFMIVAAIPLGICISLFFYTVDASMPIQIAYYSAVIILFWTAYTVFFVPYLAWGSEITLEYSERTALRGFAYFFNIFGMLIGVIIPNLIIDRIINLGLAVDTAWHLTSTGASVFVTASIFAMVFIVRGEIGSSYRQTTEQSGLEEERKHKTNILFQAIEVVRGYIELIKFRTVRLLIFACIFYLLANTFFNAGRMYFFVYNLKLSANEMTVVFLCMEATSAMLVPLILKLNKLIDKKKLFVTGMGISVLLLLLLNIIGLNTFASMCAFIVCYAIGAACYWQLISSMMYDACEADKLINRQDRAGLILSFQALSESLANAAGLQLLGLVLKVGGFNGSTVVQTAGALMACRISAAILPLVFMTLALLMIINYPINKEMYNNILDALEKRKNGEVIDLNSFSKLS